ncbi:MAG: TetR family transcriptional regulator [Roseovarius sp.]|nr:TetR family transcriptional regulator [Roseovarius sp.]
MSQTQRPRLTRDDWLAAGLAALAEAGPAALGAEPLARRIGTTKGSFYWHFADVPSFSAALLSRWQDAAFAALDPAAQTSEASLPAAARLRAAAQALASPPAEDAAIRAWAATDRQAVTAICAVDAARQSHLGDRLSECGIANPEMARMLYAAAIGMQALGAREDATDTIGSLVDLILALR